MNDKDLGNMKSIELFYRLRELLDRNPRVINELPLDDMKACIFAEVYGLRQVYYHNHLDRIEKKIISIIDNLDECKKDGDYEYALDLLDTLIDLFDLLPDSVLMQDLVEQANFDRAYLRHHELGTTLVIGDSHVNFFSGNANLSFIPIKDGINTCIQNNNYPITVLHLGPCLAFKSNQYGSSNNFLEKMDYLVENFIQPKSKIVFSLGEIDIRAHVFKETLRQNVDYKQIVDGILENYIIFLNAMKNKQFEVFAWGPIATQNDGLPIDKNNPRFGTVKQRNIATEYFNNALKEKCGKNDIGFFSIYEDMITDDYLTKKEYISDDGFHLGQYAYSKIIGLMENIGAI